MSAESSAASAIDIGLADLQQTLPYGPSFLFLDRAHLEGDVASGTYQIKDTIPFLNDHFKHGPVFPGSIMIEAMGQLGILYLLKGQHPVLEANRPDAKRLFFTSADGIRCFRVCKPGDVLDLTMTCRKVRPPLAIFRGSITCKGEKVATVDAISLIFESIILSKESVPTGS